MGDTGIEPVAAAVSLSFPLVAVFRSAVIASKFGKSSQKFAAATLSACASKQPAQAGTRGYLGRGIMVSRYTFQEPSDCFLNTVRNVPTSVRGSPPVFCCDTIV